LINPRTIYFGGGTPSLATPDTIQKILERFTIEKNTEITIEINPATVDSYVLNKMKEIGVNRISIGAQSMIDDELKFLGRVHDVKDIFTLYENGINDIFESVSYDYIYGLPFQTVENVSFSIQQLLSLSPSHISIYCLSLEDSVPLYTQIKNLPGDEVVADMYDGISGHLRRSGMMQYELSSFATDGHEARHNICYWSGSDYIGLGAGACGFLDKTRYENNTLKKYLQDNFISYKISLSDVEMMQDYIITGLRMAKGISAKDFYEKFQIDLLEKYHSTIKKLQKKKYIIVDDYVKINPKYYFTSNEVLCEFL
jgi:oxygen-independent coproporphyrinogen-3 oxidase